jgi:hypothetical protein
MPEKRHVVRVGLIPLSLSVFHLVLLELTEEDILIQTLKAELLSQE